MTEPKKKRRDRSKPAREMITAMTPCPRCGEDVQPCRCVRNALCHIKRDGKADS